MLARADCIDYLPLLIMHGDADRLAAPEGSRALYDAVMSEDKTLKLYPGFYHELYNEPEAGPLEDTLGVVGTADEAFYTTGRDRAITNLR